MSALSDFTAKFDDFGKWKPTDQVDYITYYLTTIGSHDAVTGRDIDKTFQGLDLKPYKRVAAYLSENASSPKGKYVKAAGGGYKLERNRFDEIGRVIKQEPTKVNLDTKLVSLIDQINDVSEKDFLREATNCYRVESYRAFIIMVWIVAVNHLQKFIFANSLISFNGALANHPDKKVKKIINYDDFSDLSESKFIELARASGLVSNDVRKILDEKLGIRNSAAHPSGIKISGHKATEFALDVIDNVLLKYQ